MKKTILSTLISAALVAAAAAPALAQTGSPGAEGPQARHSAQRQHEGQRAFRLPSERVEARLAYLKTALKITDAQQAQWDAFAATLRKHAKESDQRVQKARADGVARRETGARPTAIERMERGQARLAALPHGSPRRSPSPGRSTRRSRPSSRRSPTRCSRPAGTDGHATAEAVRGRNRTAQFVIPAKAGI